MKRVFPGIDTIPIGSASDTITPGCLVLEGGAFRGIYTGGVTDALMENDINFQCTAGVSAGALYGMNYTAGHIGRGSKANLLYRHDSRYIGLNALSHEHSIIGFDFIFNGINEYMPFNYERFMDPKRRFVAAATDCITGMPTYFDRDSCSDIYKAIQASSSLPLFSQMVTIDETPYLDGGCSVKLPIEWALDQGYEKIVVVRTRHREFRYTSPKPHLRKLESRIYANYPKLVSRLMYQRQLCNDQYELLDELEASGRIFVIAPSIPLNINHLESNLEKLARGYFLGFNDTMAVIDDLKAYLKS